MTQPAIFASTVQQSNEWLKALVGTRGILDEHIAYGALRAVLQQLRDRLTVEEATDLGAQLPLLLRGVYYEGWNPVGKPEQLDHRGFIEGVREKLRAHPEIRPEVAVAAVFRLLERKVTDGEIRDVKSLLPEDFALYWSHGDKAQPDASRTGDS